MPRGQGISITFFVPCFDHTISGLPLACLIANTRVRHKMHADKRADTGFSSSDEDDDLPNLSSDDDVNTGLKV